MRFKVDRLFGVGTMGCLYTLTARTWAKIFAVVSLLLFLGSQAEADTYHGLYGLDSTLSQAHVDPLAQNDSFLSLSPSQKRFLGQSGSFDTYSKIRSLLSLETTIPITVKLIGFSSEDRLQFENQFNHYIDVLSRDDKVKVIGGESHDLVVRAKATVVVEPSARPLADTIHEAIKDQVGKAASLASPNLQPVDYTVVDEIIQGDLAKPMGSYNIYLLNLSRQARPYAYSYSWREPSPAYSRCLGSIWTGSDRYMWIDLAAGPVEYGPALSGEGLLPRGDTHPLATLHSSRHGTKAFIADLASLIWGSIQMLLAPSLRIPVPFEAEMEVHFIHIQGSEQEADVKGLDWDIIEKTFLQESKSGLLLQRQHLKFRRHVLKWSSCSLCVAAVSRSLRSYTSRFHFENYTLIVSEYLDSKQLHSALRHAKHELNTKAGVPHSSSARVVPVYIFDLEQDRHLLLDRYHQSMAFKDMVIAVRTRSSQGVSDYTCNGRHVVSQTRQLERPIVGALLQCLWGVTPTHLRWSTQHNGTIVDYTWGVGQTPFGPFSDMLSLSFVQKDAAPRNMLFTTLNGSVSSAIDVLQSLKAHGGERKLLGPKRHVEFMQRWNVYHFKLERALSAMSHFEFDIALYFLKSLEYDLFRMHILVFEAATELQTALVCFKDPPFPWRLIGISAGVLALLLYLWIKRDKLFSNKKKRF